MKKSSSPDGKITFKLNWILQQSGGVGERVTNLSFCFLLNCRSVMNLDVFISD